MQNTTSYSTLELAQLLSQAFINDPWIQALFPDDPVRMQYFFEFIIHYSKLMGGSVLTHTQDNLLVGVACIESPTHQNTFINILKLTKVILTFMIKCGPKKLLLANRYMKLALKYRPKERHHYLTCIGVAPNLKGSGIGKKMLIDIHNLVEQDTHSLGIGLDTENKDNIGLYEYFGYKLTGTEKLDSVTIYTLFRKTAK
jgi:ribosomal protein S18 acetylase RimI-like enzyme